MTNEELIAKIKAEIERLKNDWASLEDELTDAMVTEYDYLLNFLTTLESEKPMNTDDAMKELDEKIALVKRRGTWDGVDVDKYMDEVRGREPRNDGLEEDLTNEADKMFFSLGFYEGDYHQPMLDDISLDQFRDIARHFAQWGAEHLKE